MSENSKQGGQHTRYPKFRLSYGVQAQSEKGGKWMHCHKNGEPLIFNTIEEARAALKQAQGEPK
jgi:hypothetical protein